jgi:predicted ATPase
LAHCGRPCEGRAIIERTVARAEQLGGTFDLPDLMRAHGQILLAQSDIVSAETRLVRSIDLARKQAALGWELRSAITLARLWTEHGCVHRAGKMLAGVYRQFTEGFETVDLDVARRILKSLDCPVD